MVRGRLRAGTTANRHGVVGRAWDGTPLLLVYAAIRLARRDTVGTGESPCVSITPNLPLVAGEASRTSHATSLAGCPGLAVGDVPTCPLTADQVGGPTGHEYAFSGRRLAMDCNGQ